MSGDGVSRPGQAPEAAPLPPVSTQWSPEDLVAESAQESLVPPFYTGEGSVMDMDQLLAPEDEQVEQPVLEPAAAEYPWDSAQPTVQPWEEPGAAEAWAAEQVSGEQEEAIDTIPTDAFFVPEGVSAPPVAPTVEPLHTTSHTTTPRHSVRREIVAVQEAQVVAEVADKLQDLADRLREQGVAAIGSGMVRGDRLEMLLSGFLAGYISARSE